MGIAVGNPSKVKGNLKVSKPKGKISADEPSSLQGGNTPMQGQQNVPQQSLNPQMMRDTNTQTPQNASSSVNSPTTKNSGLKMAITKKVLGKKKSTK